MLWIKEVEMVDSLEELKSSQSTAGKNIPNFEMSDARLTSALNKIIENCYFKKKVSLEQQDYADLFSVTLRDDNVQEFDTRWDEVLLSMSKIPSHEILESLYKWRIRESDQLKTELEVFEMEIHQKISRPNFQILKTMMMRRKDQKLRLRNFDARHKKIETGAVVKSRKGSIGVARGNGECHQWKGKGQCAKGDQYSFRHESNDRAPKPTPKAGPRSEPQNTRG